MTLRVERGKGRKDRYAMLSVLLLERLRARLRVGKAQGKYHVGPTGIVCGTLTGCILATTSKRPMVTSKEPGPFLLMDLRAR